MESLRDVEVRVEPEPPEDERLAVEEALRRARERHNGGRSAWWRAGVRENVAAAETGLP